MGMPETLPYRPAAHALQTSVPPRLYQPAGHGLCIAEVDPEGHANPAAHAPVHCELTRPDIAPKRPAGHCPLHDANAIPGLVPYCPALQFVQLPAPARLNVPDGHTEGEADTDPGTQKYPAEQRPEQASVDRPDVAPYRPALQFVQLLIDAMMY